MSTTSDRIEDKSVKSKCETKKQGCVRRRKVKRWMEVSNLDYEAGLKTVKPWACLYWQRLLSMWKRVLFFISTVQNTHYMFCKDITLKLFKKGGTILDNVGITREPWSPPEVRALVCISRDQDRDRMGQGQTPLPIIPHARPSLWITWTWPSLSLLQSNHSATDLPLLIPQWLSAKASYWTTYD